MNSFDQRDFDRAQRLVQRFEAAIDSFNTYERPEGKLWASARFSILEAMLETGRSYTKALVEFNIIAHQVNPERAEEVHQDSLSKMQKHMDILESIFETGGLVITTEDTYHQNIRYRYACVFLSELQTAYLSLKAKSFIPQKQAVKLK